MEHLLKALGSASAQTVGLAIAAGLILAIRLLLPASDRKLLPQPYFYLGTHVLFRAALYFIDDTSPLGKLVNIVSLGSLLAAIRRCTILLILDVIVHSRLESPI